MDSRVIIFWEKDFPFVDTVEIGEMKEFLKALPPMESVRSAGVDELRKRLRRESADMLINPYGSAFPEDAWPEISEFLQAGGNLLNLGGAPFSVPVAWDGDWKQKDRTDVYHRQIGISAVHTIEMPECKRFETLPEEPLLSGLTEHLICDRAFALDMCLTGPINRPGARPIRERVLRPLLYAVDRELISPGWKAAPVVAVDHFYGPYAGGRWVLVNFLPQTSLRREILTRLAGYCAGGISDFHVRPSFACYYPDERASLILHANRFEREGSESGPLTLHLLIRKDKTPIQEEDIDITDFHSPYYREIRLTNPLSPGLYTVEATLSTGDPYLTDKSGSHCFTGFWCCDDFLISTTQALETGKDSFLRKGKPSLMIGATYTAPDVGDDLFFDPNPAEWNRDFAQMDEAGVNLVRVGLKSGYRRLMMNAGAPSEDVLRAVTAFLLTAANYDFSVVFSIFDGMPEKWEGEHPYSDPKSLYAQKEFVAALTRRLSKFNNVMWELIDEPLLSDDVPDSTRLWMKEMAGIVRRNCNPEQMITVGAADLPGESSPWSYSESVDFSTVHDLPAVEDVLSSALVGRLSGKPSFLAESANAPKDCSLAPCGSSSPGSEDAHKGLDYGAVESRNRLERKLVTALASGATGVCEWLWDQRLAGQDGGSTGLRRVDRTQKAEWEIIPRFRTFLKELRHWYIDRRPEDVCMILPQSAMPVNPGRIIQAIRMSIHAMHYHCGVQMRVLGEYSLDKLGKPQLIVLPSVGMLRQDAWGEIVKAMNGGAILLATGVLDRDEHGEFVDRLSQFNIRAEIRQASETERLIIFGSEYELKFCESDIEKAVVAGTTGQIKTQFVGDGQLIYAPLPFELSESPEAVIAVYKYALKLAAVDPICTIQPFDSGILVRPLVFAKAILYSVVSELDDEKEFVLTNSLSGQSYVVRIPAGRSTMFIAKNDNGAIVATYGDGRISVQ